jgi:uncharacterized membrane protein
VGWDLLAVIPWLVFFATGAAVVGVYAFAGLVRRDAGRIGELFEGLFELASVLVMLCLFGTTVAVVVASWIYMGWWAGLAFLPLPLFLGWAMVSTWLDDPLDLYY